MRSWWIRPWESVIPKDRSALTKRGIREFRTSDYVQVISLWLECELVRNKESVSKKMLQVKNKRGLPKLREWSPLFELFKEEGLEE